MTCLRARRRQLALRAFGVCHSTLLLSALPVTGTGGAFLPRQGLGVFRHSRVSEKRSQTLSPHFSPIPGNWVGGRAERDFHGLGRQRLSVGPP